MQTPLTSKEAPNPPTLRSRIHQLLTEALEAQYTSESCQERIQTGNHYQSVKLGAQQSSGFRTDRAEFLDQIKFTNAKVLDLGSNLGELSRAARARGAWLVDGLEYDPFFIETAQLLNTYNSTTRVSFYHKDISNPAIYSEHYDIVLAFSVFTYIHGVLPQLAQITDGILIIETHKLDGNLEKDYLAHVARYFPYYRILGQSEWGKTFTPTEKRAVVAFAKTELALLAGLKNSAPVSLGDRERVRFSTIDTDRTCLQTKFFSMFQYDSTFELLTAVREQPINLAALAENRDLKVHVYSGWSYWLVYLKGYLQYRLTGAIGRGNVYYDYLMDYYIPRSHDEGLCEILSNPTAVIQRIAQRFQDLERLDPQVAKGKQQPEPLVPIRISLTDPPPPESVALRLWESGSPSPLLAALVDGWHRLFAAKLFGLKQVRCEIAEIEMIPPDATVLVPSKLEAELLKLQGRTVRYLPHFENGAGPKQELRTGYQLVQSLEFQREKGAQYLILSANHSLWLEKYPELQRHLDRSYRRIYGDAHQLVYDLTHRINQTAPTHEGRN
jgi:hypothetical protein